MLTYWETLIAARSNIAVSDSYAQLWGKKLSNAYTVATYSGTLPTTLQTVEGYLESYKIYGNTVQGGTPTPENPIIPSGCGVRVDIAGLSEPLCGIGTYIDSLELSTGILTRRIRKLVLTGEEEWTRATNGTFYGYFVTDYYNLDGHITICSHYIGDTNRSSTATVNDKACCFRISDTKTIYIRDTSFNSVTEFITYLADQYAAGTPVTAWYVLAEPEVSTVTVPSGLTGTIEGYLIQDGTPAPETPIYPTANGVKQADDTYSIPYGYKLPLTSAGQDIDIFIGDDTLSTEEYVDSGTGKIYRMVDGVLTPVDPPISFPQIPTSAGSTTISWAGGGLAPSGVELVYKVKR